MLSIELLQEKSSAADKIREQNNEVQLKIKELEHNISKHRKESQEAADKVRCLSYWNTSVPCVFPSGRTGSCCCIAPGGPNAAGA